MEPFKHLWLGIAIFLFVLAGTGDIILGILYGQVRNQWDYNYCPTVPNCINSPFEYYAYMDSDTSTDGYFGPACVANNMMGRLVAISHTALRGFYSGDPAKWNPTALANYGRIAFAITPDMLQRLLPLGRYNATDVVEELGYPPGWTCGSAALNYSDCEYRLLVWSTPCPKGAPAIVPGYWQNLDPFWRNNVYGDQTPDLTGAVNSIQFNGGLLQNYTGCDPNILINGAFNVTIQQMAGCSQRFMDAMAMFAGATCSCSPGVCTKYNSTVNCTAETTFLALKTPTAEQLRAFLMSFEAFNPYYTGYGYTAMSDYFDPLASECWFPNSLISDLQGSIEIVRLFNRTACGTNCT